MQELSESELQLIPKNAKIKYFESKVEVGKEDLASLFASLKEKKVRQTDLKFKVTELSELIAEEKRKQTVQQTQKDSLNSNLAEMRENAQLFQQKAKALNIKNDVKSNVEKLLGALQKQQDAVLKLQVQIDKQRRIREDKEFREKAKKAELMGEKNKLDAEIKKETEVLKLKLRKIGLMKKRNELHIRLSSAKSLDQKLTTKLEEFI